MSPFFPLVLIGLLLLLFAVLTPFLLAWVDMRREARRTQGRERRA